MLLHSSSSSVAQRLENHSEFVVIDNIPRQKTAYSENQLQTQETFSYKWQQTHTYETDTLMNFGRQWLRERFGYGETDMPALLKNKRILDAGCGVGLGAMMLFGDHINAGEYVGLDISTSVEIATERFKTRNIRAEFVQCNFTQVPDELGTFDIIFADGTLHHSDDTCFAIHHLARRLNPDGLFMFCVYKKKGPIREFTDDLIRSRLASFSNDEAWEKLIPLSKLGQTLGELNIQIDVDEPIDILDIPAGHYDLQRLFYYHIFKMFYREEFSLDEMNHINFDWYRPANCFRHTPEEVAEWTLQAGLAIERLHVEDSGITVVARKPCHDNGSLLV